MIHSATLKAGQLVRVKSKEEILASLDAEGRLDGLPFMPEMLAFCGQEFEVTKRAHKTCDPPNGLLGRRMHNAVHLGDVRCDGAAHGGCQARCLMFWKEAWVTPAGAETGEAPRPAASGGCSEETVVAAACNTSGAEPRYMCQSTEIPAATEPIAPWDFRQYVEDYASGNTRLTQIAGAFVAFLFAQVIDAGIGLGTPLRTIYDRFQKLRKGTPYPWRRGVIAHGERTPSVSLRLQPGELVKVKSYEEILSTINEDGNNRGMSFDAEMVPFCGGTYRVLDRISRIINEKTGVMQQMKNECIILENVVCLACYAEHRRFCPRAIFPYWREIWLERAHPAPKTAAQVLVAVTSGEGSCKTALQGQLVGS